MTTTIIISQAVEWLKKMGVKVELNTELNQYEFEYGDVFVILHTDTPEGVLSLTCPYVFADETQTRNRPNISPLSIVSVSLSIMIALLYVVYMAKTMRLRYEKMS